MRVLSPREVHCYQRNSIGTVIFIFYETLEMSAVDIFDRGQMAKHIILETPLKFIIF
jgi:hypothetical protein